MVAELSRAKRSSGASWVRKWSNLPIRKNLAITWPHTDLPPARETVRSHDKHTNVTLTLSSYFGSPLIAHQCCDQLTAVKTTSITRPYRGLRCRPSQVEEFFEVIRWQVTSFQMIAGSFFKIHMKYVASMSLWPSTRNILISNWPQTRKFSQLFKNASSEDRWFSVFSP